MKILWLVNIVMPELAEHLGRTPSVFGGWLTVLAAAYILLRTGIMDLPLVHLLVMSSLMHITGVFGDLFESLWKRQFGVKDSGSIMPGHGGLLDRFDSALFAIPTAYVYLMLFELV